MHSSHLALVFPFWRLQPLRLNHYKCQSIQTCYSTHPRTLSYCTIGTPIAISEHHATRYPSRHFFASILSFCDFMHWNRSIRHAYTYYIFTERMMDTETYLNTRFLVVVCLPLGQTGLPLHRAHYWIYSRIARTRCRLLSHVCGRIRI